MRSTILAFVLGVTLASLPLLAEDNLGLQGVPTTTITTDQAVMPDQDLLRIHKAGVEEPAVIIKGDGSVVIGEGWDLDDAARLFWERVGTNAPCAP
jgi:hypothetical protein